MKTQILIFAFAFLGLFANAASSPTVLVEKSKTFTLSLVQWKSDKINIAITNHLGDVVLDESIATAKPSRTYDLKNLPSGTYTLTLSNDLKITNQSLVVTKDGVNLHNDLTTVYKPFFVTKGNTLDVNIMTLGKSGSFIIKDVNNNVVFSDKINEMAFHKRYDLKNLESGDYTVNVELDNYFFSKLISKK